jgi:hypothetical protein
MLEVQWVKICFVFDFILHTAYTVDACALTSILPSLPLIDMIYCTAGTKATPASILRLIWIPLLHNVVKRGRNRTARFHCVFGSTDASGVRKNCVNLGWVMLGWKCSG